MKTTKISVVSSRGFHHPEGSMVDFRISVAMEADLEPDDILNEAFTQLQAEADHAAQKQYITLRRTLKRDVDNDLVKFDDTYRRERAFVKELDYKE